MWKKWSDRVEEKTKKNGDTKQFIVILYKQSLILKVKIIFLAWTWISLIITPYIL